jgi:hypothetical protein
MFQCAIFCGQVPDNCRAGWGLAPKGAGYTFGSDVFESFNHRNGIKFIARAHELTLDGYKWMIEERRDLVTIFSVPNYRKLKNTGAVLEIDEHLECSFQVFELPSNQNKS